MALTTDEPGPDSNYVLNVLAAARQMAMFGDERIAVRIEMYAAECPVVAMTRKSSSTPQEFAPRVGQSW